MNASDNLISLSDSTASLSTSLNPGSGSNAETQSRVNSSGTGLLIDFADEIQVPLPPAILTQAEVDDTFGIFSRAQSQSNQTSAKVSLLDDDASKLVRSFTSGRKSDEVKKKANAADSQNKDDLSKSGDSGNIDEEKEQNDSVGSADSDLPTIVDHTDIGDGFDPGDSANGETGISDEKMDLGASFSASGGSDSDYLDVHNLSSFSIPDSEINEDQFIEKIKKEDMVESAEAAELVNQIKLDIMLEEERRENGVDIAKYKRDLLNMSRPVLSSTAPTVTRSTFMSTVSSTSSITTTHTRLSSISDRGEGAGGNLTESTATFSSRSSSSRVSTGIMNSSPIRASYPLSKFYMPTPNSKTPSRVAARENKFSESMYSPSRTRVVLVTGDLQRSPSTRVPVRKSISAETLHYEKSPFREPTRPIPKFSTPSSSATKSRYSFNIQSPTHPSAYNDQTLGTSNLNRNYFTVDADERNRLLYLQPRQGRLSYASSASSTSINHSPNSTVSKMSIRPIGNDVSQLCKQMKEVKFQDHVPSFRPSNTISSASVQPMKATAIIPPTKEFISKDVPEAKVTVKSKRISSSATTSASGQKKFIPPIASSSPVAHPKAGPSPSKPRSGITQTTPSRSRYSVNNVRSSGYGRQNLNSTFESKLPLTSPNKIPPPSAATASAGTSIKAPVFSRTAKVGASAGAKVGATSGAARGIPAPKILKAPAVSGVTGLRRPTTVSNKENNLRTTGTRIGGPRK